MPLSEARRQPQLNLEDLLHLRWLAGGGLALISIGTLFHLESATWPVAVLAIGAVLVAMAFPALPGRVPRGAWRVGVPAIALFFAIDLYLGEMIPAFVRLTTLLVVQRAVSHRSRREDLQLVVLCLFLVIVSGVLAVSMAFAVQILAFASLAMVFLFIVNLIHDMQGDDPAPSAAWALISRKRMLVRLGRTLDLRSVLLGAALLAAVVLISTLIFLVIPRIQMDGTLSFLQLKRARSVTGFSETIALGEVTDIARDDSVAMRVDVRGGGSAAIDPYWRMVVLDEYGQGVFRVSRAIQARVGARTTPMSSLAPEHRTDGPARPTTAQGASPLLVVFLEGGISRHLPLPEGFERVRFFEMQELVANPVFSVYATQRQSAVLLSYQIEGADFGGIVPDPGFPTLHLRAPATGSDEEGALDERFLFRHMSYPATTTALPVAPEEREFLRSIARRIARGESLDAASFARRACDYLAENHRYSLEVALPATDTPSDPVVRWMRAGLSGHCEFFAAAFTLLSRSAGFPTRAVTGFRGGRWNAYEDYYMVRNSDAHAWCEVYDGRGAWFRVDPTPGAGAVAGATPLEEGVVAMVGDRSFSAYVDSLRMIWYRRVVSFDKASQNMVVGTVRGWGVGAAAGARAVFSRAMTEAGKWMERPWTLARHGGLLSVASAVVLLVLLIRRSGIGLSDVNGWIQTGEGPTRRRAGALLRRLQLRLAEPAARRHWDPARARDLEARLLEIRFGRRDRWPDARAVFRLSRRML